MDPSGRLGLSASPRGRAARALRAWRAAVYGVLVMAVAGLGCNLKSCSCKGLPTGILTRPAPAKKKGFTDVELLSEGSGPRVELRVARWVGLRYRVVLESSGSLGLEGQPAPYGPTIVMTLEHEVLRGTADPILVPRDGGTEERIEERLTIEALSARHPDLPREILDGWNGALRPLIGSSVRQQVTASAGIALMKSELLGGERPPKEVLGAVDAALEAQRHFPFRLPPGPVGVGATWRFRESVTANGIAAAQIADMTLKAVDARTAVVGILLRQEAPRQEVPHPFTPGKKAVIDDFRGDGQGEVVVDRFTAVPLKGRLVGAARLVMSGEVNGKYETATLVASSVVTARSVLLDDSADGGRVQATP